MLYLHKIQKYFLLRVLTHLSVKPPVTTNLILFEYLHLQNKANSFTFTFKCDFKKIYFKSNLPLFAMLKVRNTTKKATGNILKQKVPVCRSSSLPLFCFSQESTFSACVCFLVLYCKGAFRADPNMFIIFHHILLYKHEKIIF